MVFLVNQNVGKDCCIIALVRSVHLPLDVDSFSHSILARLPTGFSFVLISVVQLVKRSISMQFFNRQWSSGSKMAAQQSFPTMIWWFKCWSHRDTFHSACKNGQPALLWATLSYRRIVKSNGYYFFFFWKRSKFAPIYFDRRRPLEQSKELHIKHEFIAFNKRKTFDIWKRQANEQMWLCQCLVLIAKKLMIMRKKSWNIFLKNSSIGTSSYPHDILTIHLTLLLCRQFFLFHFRPTLAFPIFSFISISIHSVCMKEKKGKKNSWT